MTSNDQSKAASTEQDTSAKAKKRVLFPWLLLGCLVALLIWFNMGNFVGDERFVYSTLSLILSVILLGFWYLFRGRSPLWVRLGLAASPFLAIFVFGSLFEFEHDGDARIVGLNWQGGVNPDQMLAPLEIDSAVAEASIQLETTPYDYPRFLGNGYWPEASGVALATDWKETPPQELWRQPIGAGWSSFAMVGDYAFTQEQRGKSELVVCYDAQTGKAIWTHEDVTRFDPEDTLAGMGGRGPRATPTVAIDAGLGEGLDVVLSHGATGIINCLEATTGKVLWSVDTTKRFNTTPLMWGNSSSPLLVQGNEETPPLAIFAIGGPLGVQAGNFDASLVAFNLATGEIVWQSGWRETSYSSPTLVELHNVATVVQVNQDFVTGYDLSDGKILWEHPWPGSSSGDASVSQTIPVGDNQLLLSKGYGVGSSLIQIEKNDNQWTTIPSWSPPVKTVLKNKLSNLVIRDGFAYGLDGGILQCIEITTGKSQWKKRRRPPIGHGQLLAVGENLLITSETGELILLKLSPEKYDELDSMRVLSDDAICWNNPALSKDLLIVRNSEEAAAYRLPLMSNQ